MLISFPQDMFVIAFDFFADQYIFIHCTYTITYAMTSHQIHMQIIHLLPFSVNILPSTQFKPKAYTSFFRVENHFRLTEAPFGLFIIYGLRNVLLYLGDFECTTKVKSCLCRLSSPTMLFNSNGTKSTCALCPAKCARRWYESY